MPRGWGRPLPQEPWAGQRTLPGKEPPGLVPKVRELERLMGPGRELPPSCLLPEPHSPSRVRSLLLRHPQEQELLEWLRQVFRRILDCVSPLKVFRVDGSWWVVQRSGQDRSGAHFAAGVLPAAKKAG